MHIEINAAHGVERSTALDRHIHDKLERIDRHHGERLTQVLVFLEDVNGHKGGVDTCCRLEARPAGLGPVTVEAMDTDAYRAVKDGVDKLDRAIEHRLGRVDDRH